MHPALQMLAKNCIFDQLLSEAIPHVGLLLHPRPTVRTLITAQSVDTIIAEERAALWAHLDFCVDHIVAYGASQLVFLAVRITFFARILPI